MGSSELYRVVEGFPEVLDSLIVGVELPGGNYYMPLFVVLREGVPLDDALKRQSRGRYAATSCRITSPTRSWRSRKCHTP